MHRTYLANVLAAYLDFTIGCCAIVVLAVTFSVELVWWQVIVGGLLALLPDIDIAPMLIVGKTPRFDHRQSIFHRPILMLPVVALLGYLIGGTFWALASAILVLYHYLHDIDWSGQRYGIAWFWPLSKQFWGPYGFFTPPTTVSHETWLKDKWLQPSHLSIIELSVALVAAIFLGVLLGVITTWWFIGTLLLAAAMPLFVWYG